MLFWLTCSSRHIQLVSMTSFGTSCSTTHSDEDPSTASDDFAICSICHMPQPHYFCMPCAACYRWMCDDCSMVCFTCSPKDSLGTNGLFWCQNCWDDHICSSVDVKKLGTAICEPCGRVCQYSRNAWCSTCRRFPQSCCQMSCEVCFLDFCRSCYANHVHKKMISIFARDKGTREIAFHITGMNGDEIANCTLEYPRMTNAESYLVNAVLTMVSNSLGQPWKACLLNEEDLVEQMNIIALAYPNWPDTDEEVY